MMWIDILVASVFAVFGVVSAARSLGREPATDETARDRFLIAVHDAAKALFWFALGAFVLAYGFAEDPHSLRWLLLIPLGMAVVRLLAATALSRG